MSSSSLIQDFLCDVINADFIDFVPTDKNRRTLYLLGLTFNDMEDIVRHLKPNEYYAGPLDDHDLNRSGQLWIFKHKYEEHILYIKLKEKIIVEETTRVKCLSCHIDFMI